jgi:L-lactate dehydrogenase complex protein LldG
VEREPFLAEIAARLGRPRLRTAPVRDAGVSAPFAPDLGPDELGTRFAHELTLVGGEVVLAGSAEAAYTALADLLSQAAGVVTWSLSELAGSSGLDLSALWGELGARCVQPLSPEFRAAALRADVGVTGADFAIADTGTLVISAGLGRPRAASLLPRLHVALVRQSRLVSRLGQALARFRDTSPSALHFVTGPSRTSDIENDLSIGVHGPARVLALVVPEARR